MPYYWVPAMILIDFYQHEYKSLHWEFLIRAFRLLVKVVMMRNDEKHLKKDDEKKKGTPFFLLDDMCKVQTYHLFE